MISQTLEILSRHSPKWMRRALCTDADPDLFYREDPPPRGTDERVMWLLRERKRVAAAIRICNHCPVKINCLMWAYQTGDRHAILGGKTAKQRARVSNRVGYAMGRPDRAP